MGKTCTVINVEKGILEPFAILLLRSIKEFGGKLAETDILCFQPRRNFAVSSATKKIIRSFGAEFVNEDINKTYKFYALANKPGVCSWVESNLNYENIIFLDTDTLVLNEPVELFLKTKEQVGVVPVYEKGIGILGKEDLNYHYWKRIYSYLGEDVDSISSRIQTLYREEIYPYWNTGVISAKTDLEVFSKWNELTEWALKTFTLPTGSNYFVEESGFSALIFSKKLFIKNLEYGYNFPIIPRLNDIGFYDEFNTNNLTIIHHLRGFQFLLNILEEENSEKSKWILRQLEELGLIKSFINKIHFKYYSTRKWFLEKVFYIPLRLNKKKLENS